MLEQIAVTITEIIVLVIFVYLLKGRLDSYLKHHGTKEQGLKNFKSLFKIDFKKPLLVIIVPAALIIIVDLSLVYITKQPFSIGYDLPFWYLLIQTVIIAPIFEEFAFRGAFLGSSLVDMTKKPPKSKYFWYGLLLVAQAWLFMIWHNFGTPMMFYFNIFRFTGGFLYGLLYIAYGRNLVPCIIAHSASNLLILLTVW
jgi:membrane protease YdiL (CAAX protease family)